MPYEEAVLPPTLPLFLAKLHALVGNGRAAADSSILFVNDGSQDSTWDLITVAAQEHPEVRGICLGHNRRHQNALLAGLLEARESCDITISIDCDGQDDFDAMDGMLDAHRDGVDIVYGVREDWSAPGF